MFYIKYLDSYVTNNKFLSVKEAAKKKPLIIEAVGYKIDEDGESISIANNTCGKTFRRVLRVPKKAILESSEVTNNAKGFELKEISYVDTQMTGEGVTLTLEKYVSMPKPPIVNLCGFLVVEDAENIYLAMERSSDTDFRIINIIPKKFISEKK